MRDINGIDFIVLVGHEDEARDIANGYNCTFVYHPNNPLGSKWNVGWRMALNLFNPDHYIFVGSSDWLCADYLDIMLPHMDDYDIIGVRGMYLIDYGDGLRRVCKWHGYKDEREGESIGIGRILSRDIVTKMNGTPFNPIAENSLDFSMMLHAESWGAKIGLIDDPHAKTLSVSCYKWENKHKFEDHWRDHMNNDVMGDGREFLEKHFPDALTIQL